MGSGLCNTTGQQKQQHVVKCQQSLCNGNGNSTSRNKHSQSPMQVIIYSDDQEAIGIDNNLSTPVHMLQQSYNNNSPGSYFSASNKNLDSKQHQEKHDQKQQQKSLSSNLSPISKDDIQFKINNSINGHLKDGYFQHQQQQNKDDTSRQQQHPQNDNKKVTNNIETIVDQRKKQLAVLLNKQNVNLRDPEFDCGSPQKVIKINYNEVLLRHVSQNKSQGNLNYKPISVPFSVIKMLIPKQLSKHIEQDIPNFFSKFKNDTTSFKLHKQGFYANILQKQNSQNININSNENHNKQNTDQQEEGFGTFLHSRFFYQGNFVHKQNTQQYLPEKIGTFINCQGKYKGQFQKGKIQGKGKYYKFQCLQNQQNEQNGVSTISLFSNNKNSMSSKFQHRKRNSQSYIQKIIMIYEGKWQGGHLVKGTMENDYYKFEGQFRNQKLEGFGKILFKNSGASYIGNFRNGVMDDQNVAVYECVEFTYRGGFKNGKRHGKGVLIEKSDQAKFKSGKVRIQQKYDGIWENDMFVKRQERKE